MDILSAASRYRMFQPGDLVLCAVSGGPDSVAMLHALHARASEFDISLHVAHINHGIRGEQSNIDEDFARKLVQQFGIPITTTRWMSHGSCARRTWAKKRRPGKCGISFCAKLVQVRARARSPSPTQPTTELSPCFSTSSVGPEPPAWDPSDLCGTMSFVP